MKVDATPCPGCNSLGTLTVDIKVVALRISSFTDTGMRERLTLKIHPVLSCGACTFEVIGDSVDDYYNFPVREQG